MTMTVSDVIARLSLLPQGMPVFVRCESTPLSIREATWGLSDVGTREGKTWDLTDDPEYSRDTFENVQLALVIDVGGLE